MKVLITERQLNILENKTKYDFGFNLFKDMAIAKYPFIKKMSFNEYRSSQDVGSEYRFHIIFLDVTVNEDEMENYLYVDEDGNEDKPFEGVTNHSQKDTLEDFLGLIYDRLPKNVRYNYPNNHLRWPGEAAGINIENLIKI